VAVETGFYDVIDRAGNRSTIVESSLAEIEIPAIAAMAAIDETGQPPAEGRADRVALCRYMALQATRTPEQRERILFASSVSDYAAGRDVTRAIVEQYLEEIHLGFQPSENELSAAYDFVSVALGSPETQTREFAVEMMLRGMEQIAPVLSGFHWTIESDRKRRFITSDAPLVVWRKPTPRDEFEGIGVANAEEIRFPLDPGKQLVLAGRARPRTVRISSRRVQDCNADTASACHRFIVAHPWNRNQADAVELMERRPVIRFNSGPLLMPDGTEHGEVLHMWVPRRQPHSSRGYSSSSRRS
jgi:hypothetical protein